MDVCHNFVRVNQQCKVYLKAIGSQLSEAGGQLDPAQLFHTFSALGLDVSDALRLLLSPFCPLVGVLAGPLGQKVRQRGEKCSINSMTTGATNH